MKEDRAEIVTRILDAARETFVRDGVAKTRMGTIADEAGCSRATLYRYYATKEALVVAYAHRELDLTLKKVLAAISGETRLGNRLIEAMAVSVESVRETPAIRPFLEPDAGALSVALPLPPTAGGLEPSLFATLLSVVGEHDGTERLRPELPPAELLEWIVRIVLSLAIAPGPPRTRPELRRFLGSLVRPAFVEPTPPRDI